MDRMLASVYQALGNKRPASTPNVSHPLPTRRLHESMRTVEHHAKIAPARSRSLHESFFPNGYVPNHIIGKPKMYCLLPGGNVKWQRGRFGNLCRKNASAFWLRCPYASIVLPFSRHKVDPFSLDISPHKLQAK